MRKVAVILMLLALPLPFAHGIDVTEDTTVFGYREGEYGPKPRSFTFSLFAGGYFNGLRQNFPAFATSSANFTNFWRYGVRLGYAPHQYLEFAGHLAYTPTVDEGLDLNVYDYGLNIIGNIPLHPQVLPYATLGAGAIRFRETAVFDFTRFNINYGVGIKFFAFKNLSIAPEFLAITSFDPAHTAFSTTLNLVYYWDFLRKPGDRDGDGILDQVDLCPTQPETVNGIDDQDGCPEEAKSDRDLDGILDNVDQCPDQPETVNGIDDQDGCPETVLDQDKDGISDDKDQCPKDPETVNGVLDHDGCPETKGGDRDKDGILDENDQCPDHPETVNGFLDEDGCPENPKDLDGDGILNESDQCPKNPETKNGFLDEDGCPENPNDLDGDGILNDADQCPRQPETKNGFLDEDGCPEDPNDTDGDGILNEFDQCPKEPEIFNNYKDDDGCPDQVPNDSDGDGITDDKDKCQGPKEIYNNYKDDDGCPDHELDEFSGVVEGIFFEVDQDIIKKQSYPVLNKAALILGRYPILQFVIEGHTDNTGTDAYNLELSEKRAQSVYEYLRYRGISGDRMAVEAYGESKPIADNKTPVGRAKNRRIVFRILNLEKALQEAEEMKRRAR